jgi:hypothetical protein
LIIQDSTNKNQQSLIQKEREKTSEQAVHPESS